MSPRHRLVWPLGCCVASLAACAAAFGTSCQVASPSLTAARTTSASLLPLRRRRGPIKETCAAAGGAQGETSEATKKEFFVLLETDFGSRSPAMHNAAFRELELPHSYGVLELPKAGLEDEGSAVSEAFRTRLRSPTFGGASVTIPHKQLVEKFLDDVTESAREIGAVNTIIARGASLVGDNTDWLGVRAALDGALRRRGDDQTVGTRRRALLVGTGGTARAAAYALTRGGDDAYELFVHARDLEKAQTLAAAFGGRAIDAVAPSEANPELDAALADGGFAVVVSTIPGDAKFVVRDDVLDTGRPAVLDAAYKPAETALLLQAQRRGCAVAQGATMLVEQGIAQFELWTGCSAPRDVMRNAVFDGVPDLEH